MTPHYAERIVAFIDILGFSSLVQELGESPAVHSKLHAALRRMKSCHASSVLPSSAQRELEVSVFSDSIVMSGLLVDIWAIIWTALHLQADMLELGVLIRGGVSFGRTIHSEGMLYGEGMLAAHAIESKAAVYPRIVIDPMLAHKLSPRLRAAFLDEDQDGLWYINPFTIGITPSGAEALAADGYNPNQEALTVLGNAIDRELNSLKDVGQCAKWGWLKTQHSIAVADLAKYRAPRFWRLWAEAEKAKGAE